MTAAFGQVGDVSIIAEMLSMFGRKGGFGKKEPTIEGPRRQGFGPNDRVFDPNLWEGERGEFLRRFGFAPDDPKNRLDLQEQPVSAQLAGDNAALSKVLATLNGISPNPIGAFTLLPVELWHGRFGEFLLNRLDLSPHRAWNTIFLPLDSAGAAALGLPIGTHSADDIAELETFIEMIVELYSGKSSSEANALAITCDEMAGNFPYLFPAERLDYSRAVRDARRRVRSFAFGRAATTRFNKGIIIKSQQTFLGKPEEQLVA
jgi:hypothetical protein